MANYWLIKSEPDVYPYSRLESDGSTRWDGVRSFEARNNLRAMKPGDLALFYHSNIGKAIVAVARVATEAYADPTAPDEDWSAVDIEPEFALANEVPLAALKAHPSLSSLELVRKSRLSVTRVTEAQYDAVIALSKAGPVAVPPRESKPKTKGAKKKAAKAKPAKAKKASQASTKKSTKKTATAAKRKAAKTRGR